MLHYLVLAVKVGAVWTAVSVPAGILIGKAIAVSNPSGAAR